MSRFVIADRHTAYLFLSSVDEWLPADHLARFVVEVIDPLDLTALRRPYAGRGSAAHPPSAWLGLWVYGYATGVFSSRKIERATHDSVAFRYIAANTHPDHDTLASFRRRFLKELEGRFIQVLQVAQEMKLFRLGRIALDGTKIQANASKHRARSQGHAERIEAQLQAEVKELMPQAEVADRDATPDGMDVPAEIARREQRLAGIAEAKAKIAARAAEREAVHPAEYQEKVARREAQRAVGKTPRGQEPSPPPSGPQANDPVNLTDEESRIMPFRNGFVQGYNAQAAVDVESLLIATTPLTQAPNDKQQVVPALERLAALPEGLGRATQLLAADTGYARAANLQACANRSITPLIAQRRENHHLPLAERFAADPPGPARPSRRHDPHDPPPYDPGRTRPVCATHTDGRTGLRDHQTGHGLSARPGAGRRRVDARRSGLEHQAAERPADGLRRAERETPRPLDASNARSNRFNPQPSWIDVPRQVNEVGGFTQCQRLPRLSHTLGGSSPTGS